MPKLWNASIAAHRREVRDAILAATLTLVHERGLAGVTMSEIAARTGIGRATLYKYFADVEAILLAWHERHIQHHLEQLTAVRDGAGDPPEQLAAVLEAWALIAHDQPGTELAAALHRGAHVARAQRQLREFVRDLLKECADRGSVRGDVAVEELATYCLHALSAAHALRSRAAVRRLVRVVMTGLKAPS